MTDKMINGILFIVAGLGAIVVYLGLGETGILDKGHTEKIAAYTLLTIPLAFMMVRNVVRNSCIDAGLVVIIVGLTMGLVSDAINSAELSGESETIGEVITWTAWSIMYLGIFITAIGYLRTNLFPNWLSGLLAIFIPISSDACFTENTKNLYISKPEIIKGIIPCAINSV